MKKRHNKKRYLRKDPEFEPPPPPPDIGKTGNEDFIEHLDFIMSLTEGRRVGQTRMRKIYRKFLKKWRQRGLSFWQKWCKLPEQ